MQKRPQRVVHRVAEQFIGRRRLGERPLNRLTEQQLELRAGRAKLRRRRERQVELQAPPGRTNTR
jgi:hypothetical protein